VIHISPELSAEVRESPTVTAPAMHCSQDSFSPGTVDLNASETATLAPFFAILAISNEAIRNNWGYVPIDRDEFQDMFRKLKPIAELLDDAPLAEERLGPRRAALSYPIKSLLDKGCRVIFGSDWDVADLNPLVGPPGGGRPGG
jgi:hypothetical protein